MAIQLMLAARSSSRSGIERWHPYFTPLTEPLDLRLTESRTFSSRVVYLRYQRMRCGPRPDSIGRFPDERGLLKHKSVLEPSAR
jgi:hypothetical protein